MTLRWSVRAGPDQARRRESTPLCCTTMLHQKYSVLAECFSYKGMVAGHSNGGIHLYKQKGTDMSVPFVAQVNDAHLPRGVVTI